MWLWPVLNGTIVNAVAVAVGCAAGLAAAGKLPERYQQIILHVLGLITITLGVDAAVLRMNAVIGVYMPVGVAGKTYGARLGLLMVASLIIGSLLGTWLRLHERLEHLGETIHRRLNKGVRLTYSPGMDEASQKVSLTPLSGKRFAEGFLTASVIFCVGPLTLLGCLRNGTDGDPSYLYIKSLLDGFCAIALTASLGIGVAFSIVTVLLFQGGLALLAFYSAQSLPHLSVEMMNVVGGVILLANALLLLDIKKLPVANMLPAIFLAPVLIKLAEWITPGLLITAEASRLAGS